LPRSSARIGGFRIAFRQGPLYLTNENGGFFLSRMRSIFRLLLFLGLAAALSAAEPLLKVTVAGKTVSFTVEEFATLPHTEITTFEPHGQKEHRYAGVAVRELLLRAGAPLGVKLRGAALQLVVVARSNDGYAVAFALAEFDDAFSNRTILLAEKEDGQALAGNAAPFRLVAPGDKKGARCARMVASLEVISVGSPAPTTPTTHG
jgi:hypothetical protein